MRWVETSSPATRKIPSSASALVVTKYDRRSARIFGTVCTWPSIGESVTNSRLLTGTPNKEGSDAILIVKK
jgi:hypothetical protein